MDSNFPTNSDFPAVPIVLACGSETTLLDHFEDIPHAVEFIATEALANQLDAALEVMSSTGMDEVVFQANADFPIRWGAVLPSEAADPSVIEQVTSPEIHQLLITLTSGQVLPTSNFPLSTGNPNTRLFRIGYVDHQGDRFWSAYENVDTVLGHD